MKYIIEYKSILCIKALCNMMSPSSPSLRQCIFAMALIAVSEFVNGDVGK